MFSYSPRLDLGEVTRHNIRQLKKLNSVVFPVSYNDKFYKDVLQAGELAKLGSDYFLDSFLDREGEEELT